MEKTEILAYTAGIVDGKGCICIRRAGKKKDGTSLDVFVTNTQPWICEWLKFQYGGRIYSTGARKANWKTTYRWKVASNQASDFLKLVIPYLTIKRPQAELAIKYQKSKCSEERGMGKKRTIAERTLDEAQGISMAVLNKTGIMAQPRQP